MSNHSNHSRKYSVFSLERFDSQQDRRIASSTLLIDLRRHPRFDTSSPAELITEDGRKFSCIMTNISANGLQLECERSIQNVLQTGILSFIKRKAPLVDISFTLPNNISHKNPVRIICRAVYALKEKRGVNLIGVKFASFKEGENILTEYLSFRKLTD